MPNPIKKMAQKHLENVYLLGYIVLVRDLIKSKPPQSSNLSKFYVISYQLVFH